jgi:capsule biosynthesis phosphatase
MKRLIFDLDNTICETMNGDYENSTPKVEIISKLKEYKKNGFDIVIATSRNMRTYSNNIGKISANTLPVIIKWLNKHNIPYDEIYIGKPWCGTDGFYIDDRSIRPKEFELLSYQEVINLIKIDEK